MCPYDDGEQLRRSPLWKTCGDRGHKFLVCLDDTPAFDRVAFVDDSEHPHPMESSKKKARVGLSRAEQMWDEQNERERMGIVPALYKGKPRPAPLQVPRMCIVDASPPLHCALTRLLAVQPDAQAPRSDAREKRRAPQAYDSDDEEVDIDAALQTMHDIEAETEMLDTDSE